MVTSSVAVRVTVAEAAAARPATARVERIVNYRLSQKGGRNELPRREKNECSELDSERVDDRSQGCELSRLLAIARGKQV